MPKGFANAVGVGYDMIRHELLARIGETLTRKGDDEEPPRLIGGSCS